MAAIASAKLVADPEPTVRAYPPRFNQMLRRVANLLTATTDRPIEEAG